VSAGTPEWPCEAYGETGLQVGAWCFTTGQRARACAGPAECAATVARERQQIFGRIQDLSATGDPEWVYLAREITSPDQIMNPHPPAVPGTSP
jgi:hypothetical protein